MKFLISKTKRKRVQDNLELLLYRRKWNIPLNDDRLLKLTDIDIFEDLELFSDLDDLMKEKDSDWFGDEVEPGKKLGDDLTQQELDEQFEKL